MTKDHHYTKYVGQPDSTEYRTGVPKLRLFEPLQATLWALRKFCICF